MIIGAEIKIYNDLEYSVIHMNGRTFIQIGKYLGKEKTVIIPEIIEGLPVERMGETFYNCVFLEKVVLPDSITKIDERVFQNCVNLVDVNIPKGVKNISFYAFDGCEKLEHIELHDQITEISSYAFSRCTSLKTVKLPKQLNRIYGRAFLNCTLIENVEFPEELVNFDCDVFKNCPKMQDEQGFVIVKDRILLSYYGNDENVVIPNYITHINLFAFYKNKKLKSVILPENLKVIGGSAFRDCVNLDNVIVPPNVEVIEMQAFSGCENLTEIYIPESVMKFRTKTFAGCNNLKKIIFEHSKELSKTVTVTKTSFPFNENEINPHPILLKSWSKEQIEKLNFTKLSRFDELDADTQKLFKAELSKKTLRDTVFLKGTSADISKYFELGIKVKLIDLDAYLEHSIKNQNTEITAILLRYKDEKFSTNEKEKFQENKDLIEVGLELPTLTQLKQKWDLKNKNGCIEIYRYKGKNIEEVITNTTKRGAEIKYLPYEVLSKLSNRNQGRFLGKGEFRNLQQFEPLEKIIFANGDELILTEDFYKSSIKVLEIPPNIETIESYLLLGFENVEKVIMTDDVLVISSDAFNHAINLKEVVLSKNIIKIKEAGFFYCTSLENIILPPKIKHIDGCAFQDCHSLTEIFIPKSLKNLKNNVFLNCKNLKKVILESADTVCDKEAFKNCESLEFVGVDGGENIIEQFKI